MRFNDKSAIMTAMMVTRVEIVPATARPPVEKIVPMSGVIRVAPQVGQPAPSAMRPVMIPARSTLSAVESLVLPLVSILLSPVAWPVDFLAG